MLTIEIAKKKSFSMIILVQLKTVITTFFLLIKLDSDHIF